MRVVALKAFSTGTLTMEEKQIADLPDALAEELIAQRIVAPTALPGITDADDGKVLTADSGVWVAANPSSGGGVLVVNAEFDGESTYTLDKTWQECKDAELVSVTMEGTNTFCIGVSKFENIITHQTEYHVLVYDFKHESLVEFKTATASGYPSGTLE